MSIDPDVSDTVSVEVTDFDQPEGGHLIPDYEKGLEMPSCGTALLEPDSNWEDGSLKESMASGFRPQRLDTFYIQIYTYWRERGYLCIVMTQTLNLLALVFMIGFTCFLSLFVNWRVVLACNSQATCDEIDIINSHPFTTHWVIRDGLPVKEGPGLITAFNLLFMLVCSGFVLFTVWGCLKTVAEYWKIKQFVNMQLEITEAEMETVEWNQVIDRMVKLQETGGLIVNTKVNPLDITNRIMRRENYLIAMINKGVISFDFPLCKWMPPMLTKTMEWNLNYCIMSLMFDKDNFRVRARFLQDPDALKRWLLICGVLNLVLSPFIAVFVLLYSFFKHGRDMHKNPASLGARHWSPLARWKLREFNELEHSFEARLNSSYAGANAYVQQFPSTSMSILAKFIVFISSSFAGVIVVLSLIDESVLLYVKIFDRNLLWYLAIFGLVIAAASPFVINKRENFDPEKAFVQMTDYTHYYPSRWRNRVHSPETYQAFAQLYPLKLITFAHEVLSIFVVPIMLIFYLPKQANAITRFVKDFTETGQSGDVCSFSVFDFENHGHAKYGARKADNQYYRSKQGKMEKSFLTFLENHPTWEPSEDGRLLVQKVEARRRERDASIASSMDNIGEASMSSMHSSLEDIAATPYAPFNDV